MSATKMWPMNCSVWATAVCTNFRGGLLYRRRRTGVEPLKLVIFHLMHFAHMVRCVWPLVLLLLLTAYSNDADRWPWKMWVYNVRKLNRSLACTTSATSLYGVLYIARSSLDRNVQLTPFLCGSWASFSWPSCRHC